MKYFFHLGSLEAANAFAEKKHVRPTKSYSKCKQFQQEQQRDFNLPVANISLSSDDGDQSIDRTDNLDESILNASGTHTNSQTLNDSADQSTIVSSLDDMDSLFNALDTMDGSSLDGIHETDSANHHTQNVSSIRNTANF